MPFSESSALAKKGEAEHSGKVEAIGSGGMEPVKAEPEAPEIEKIEAEEAAAEAEAEPAAPTVEPEAAAASVEVAAPERSRMWSVLGPLLVLAFAIALIGGTLYIARHL